MKFYVFIGRTNPPTSGHIHILTEIAKLAKEAGTIGIVLLGAGPGGNVTMDNPIDFSLKRKVIEHQLGDLTPFLRIERKEPHPAVQIRELINVENIPDTEVEVVIVAGNKIDKDNPQQNDLQKNKWLIDALTKHLSIKFETKVSGLAISPLMELDSKMETAEPMSASSVRIFAYKSFLNESLDSAKSAKDSFREKYKTVYDKELADEVFLQIIGSFTKDEMEEYVETGKITKKRKTKSPRESKSPRKTRKKLGGKKYVQKKYFIRTRKEKV